MSPEQPHPRILLTADKITGLRARARARTLSREGRVSGRLWQGVLAAADAAMDAGPITVFTPLPGRTPEDLRQGNPEYIVVDAAGQRVLKCALGLCS